MLLGVFAAVAIVMAVQKMEENAGVAETWEAADGTIHTNLRYGDKERNLFDLYLPAGIERHDSAGVMLFIHGGGWISGDKQDMAYACKRYAKRGYATATMNYTLIDSLRRGNIPQMLREIEACVGQLKTELEQRGITPSRMAVGGVSAGGHLAMLYAYKCAAQSPIPVAFVAQRVGPANLSLMFNMTEENIEKAYADRQAGHPTKEWQELDNLIYNACELEMKPEWYNKQSIDSLLLTASPVHYLQKNSVPGVFAYGEKDWLVPFAHAGQLSAVCDSLGVTYVCICFPNSGHALEADPELHKQFTECIEEYARKNFGY